MSKIAEKLLMCGVTASEVIACIPEAKSRAEREFIIQLSQEMPALEEAKYEPDKKDVR
jgi:hypothetical protein